MNINSPNSSNTNLNNQQMYGNHNDDKQRQSICETTYL